LFPLDQGAANDASREDQLAQFGREFKGADGPGAEDLEVRYAGAGCANVEELELY